MPYARRGTPQKGTRAQLELGVDPRQLSIYDVLMDPLRDPAFPLPSCGRVPGDLCGPRDGSTTPPWCEWPRCLS